MDKVSLRGKVAIVTGSNTGIGKETARELAKRGCKVIMACRSEQRALAARDEILQDPKITAEQIVFKKLDLGSLQSVRDFANKFNAEAERLDLLVNNAGLVVTSRQETVGGFELHMGVNHLGHFLLTLLLLEKLKASVPSRIINVSSKAHEYGEVDLEDINIKTGVWKSLNAYGRSKTANILFTVALAHKLQGTGVTAHSLHPGIVDTEFPRNLNPCLNCIVSCLGKTFLRCMYKTARQGAETTLYCCLEPSLAESSGGYYSDCRRVEAKPYATNLDIALKLWDLSEKLVGPV